MTQEVHLVGITLHLCHYQSIACRHHHDVVLGKEEVSAPGVAVFRIVLGDEEQGFIRLLLGGIEDASTQ